MVDVKKAMETLREYKAGKQALEARVIENEQWYKLRHWEQVGKSKNPGDPEPSSAWLFNSLTNKHADAMDNYPEPVILPREEGDRADAEALSEIMPVIMEQQRFEETYDRMWWRKLKSGTGVLGVFWDSGAQNGLGDIKITSVDMLSIYWEPGVDELQESRNVFVVKLMDNDLIEQKWPEAKDKLGGDADVSKYLHDDNVDTSKKSAVIDWYYKVRVGTRTLLHFCKFCADVVLYSSEDDPGYAQEGYYAHGRYPFVFDPLFRVEGSPAGFGWLDVCKDPQMYIDKLGQVILKNAIMGSRRRFFARVDGGINEEEYADWSKDFVHFSGANPQDSIMPIEVPKLDTIYANVLTSKIEELKETSGNRDFSQGSTMSGVTAASAIAALQEAGSKLSRDMLKSSYRAYADVCYLVLELIRQFYDEPRMFRIIGANGAEQFVLYSNAGIKAQSQGSAFGVDAGVRVPIFDIQVKTQKKSGFSTLSQNEMAKEFFAAGFFNPQLSDQALACIEMMDFEGKAQVQKRIAQNGTMFMQMQQQIMQLSAMVDKLTGGALTGGQPQGQQGDREGGRRPTGEARSVTGASPMPPANADEAGRIDKSSTAYKANEARERARAATEVK